MHKTGWDAGVSSLHRIVCKVWTVRNRPVNLTPRKRETRDLRIEAPSSKRVQREGGSSSRIEKAATKANMTVEQFAKVMKEILEEKEWFLDRISLPGNPRKLTPEEIEQLEKEGRV